MIRPRTHQAFLGAWPTASSQLLLSPPCPACSWPLLGYENKPLVYPFILQALFSTSDHFPPPLEPAES